MSGVLPKAMVTRWASSCPLAVQYLVMRNSDWPVECLSRTIREMAYVFADEEEALHAWKENTFARMGE